MADVARGERIRALRKQRERESENGKLTQPMVAEAVGVTLRAYQDWESSTEEKPKGIATSHARKLARVLGVEFEDIARREDEPEANPWAGELRQIQDQLDTIARDQALILKLLRDDLVQRTPHADPAKLPTRKPAARRSAGRG